MKQENKNIINVENKIVLPLSDFFGEERLTLDQAVKIIHGESSEITLEQDAPEREITDTDNFVLGDFVTNTTYSTIATQKNAVGTVIFGSPNSLTVSNYTVGSGGANSGAIYYVSSGNYYLVGDGLNLYKLTKVANNNWNYQLLYTASAGAEITQILFIPSVSRIWLLIKSTLLPDSVGYILILDTLYNVISTLLTKYYSFAYNPFNLRVVAVVLGVGIVMETLNASNGVIGNITSDAITFPNSEARNIRVVTVDTFDIGTVVTGNTISIERLQAVGITWNPLGTVTPTTNTYGLGYTIEYSRIIEETATDFFMTGYFTTGAVHNGFYLKINKALFTLTDEARVINGVIYSQKLNTGLSANILSLGVGQSGAGAYVYQLDTTLVYANADLTPIIAIPRIDYTLTQTSVVSYVRAIELDYDTLNNWSNNNTEVSIYSPYVNLPSGIGFNSINNLTFEELRYWLMTNPVKITRIVYQVLSGDTTQVFNPLKKVSRDSNGNLCEKYIVTVEDLYQSQNGVIIKDLEKGDQFTMDADNYITFGLKPSADTRLTFYYDKRIMLRKNLN